jgi:hypothetical protein
MRRACAAPVPGTVRSPLTTGPIGHIRLPGRVCMAVLAAHARDALMATIEASVETADA